MGYILPALAFGWFGFGICAVVMHRRAFPYRVIPVLDEMLFALIVLGGPVTLCFVLIAIEALI